MDYGLSYKECKIKNSKVFFYETFDSRIADKIIRLNKYLYYIEEKPHWKSGKVRDCYVFEGYYDLVKLVDNIKKELFGDK